MHIFTFYQKKFFVPCESVNQLEIKDQIIVNLQKSEVCLNQ